MVKNEKSESENRGDDEIKMEAIIYESVDEGKKRGEKKENKRKRGQRETEKEEEQKGKK